MSVTLSYQHDELEKYSRSHQSVTFGFTFVEMLLPKVVVENIHGQSLKVDKNNFTAGVNGFEQRESHSTRNMLPTLNSDRSKSTTSTIRLSGTHKGFTGCGRAPGSRQARGGSHQTLATLVLDCPPPRTAENKAGR